MMGRRPWWVSAVFDDGVVYMIRMRAFYSYRQGKGRAAGGIWGAIIGEVVVILGWLAGAHGAGQGVSVLPDDWGRAWEQAGVEMRPLQIVHGPAKSMASIEGIKALKDIAWGESSATCILTGIWSRRSIGRP